MSRAFLCVTIDCECDKGPGWRSQRPMRFAGVQDGIAKRLQPLFRARRDKPTYLLSPEILRDEASVETLRTLDGDAELGAHLHGEYAEPGAFEPDVTTAFQRDYPPDVERDKLAYLTDLFARAFGRKPASFRAGRFGIGPSSLGILDELGYAVESSVTPHMDWSSAGSRGLSFLGAPTQPYHPDPTEPARPGKSRLLEVPVTIRPHALGGLPLIGRTLEPRWLRPTRGTAERLLAVARDEIKSARAASPDKPVVLNAMFHNVEVIPGASPYAASEDEARAILGRLAALLDFAEGEDISVIGLSDVAELFA
jgi:hypothetical protein